MEVKTGRIKEVYNSTLIFRKRFPVGSIFKVILSLAFDYPFCYLCLGKERIEGKIYKCSLRDGHGKTDFYSAFINSCNLYFLKFTEKKQLDSLINFVKRLRITEKVGKDISGEINSRFILTKDNFYEVIMGQGKDVMFTPISILALFSGIANDGVFLKPCFSGEKEVLTQIEDKKRIRRIKHLLRAVAEKGTAKILKDTEIAGKTGTAKWINGWRYHGWFVGYFPFYSPEYAVVVFLYKGEGKDAAKIAKKVVEKFAENGMSSF